MKGIIDKNWWSLFLCFLLFCTVVVVGRTIATSGNALRGSVIE
ncbi:MAG: hypothetical protein V1703_01975 [Candidatus Altiarchaeota archaeon]